MYLRTLSFYLSQETYGSMKQKLWKIKAYLNKFELYSHLLIATSDCQDNIKP